MRALKPARSISLLRVARRQLLAQRVESAEVVAYDDLGTEALRRIVVRDFPVFVGVDVKGSCIYDLE